MDEEKRKEIAVKLSGWYCGQNGTEPWIKADNKKYVSMVSLLGKNSLDLKKEIDVFKLFTLALNWNSRKYGRFDAGLALFKTLDDANILNSIFYEKLKRNNWKTNVANKIMDSYCCLRDEWENIYQKLRGPSNLDIESFILNLYGKFCDKQKTTPLKVKLFFVLREMKVQRVLEISDDFCCVPDQNVRKLMHITGLLSKKWKNNLSLREMIDTSKEISLLFNRGEYRLYDMPLFWFYRTQCFCTPNCIIYGLCERNFNK